MTVIAWDKNIVVTDSRCTDGAGTHFPVQKLFRIAKGPRKGHIVATTGSSDTACIRFVNWYQDMKGEPFDHFEWEYEEFINVIFTPQGAFFADHQATLCAYPPGNFAAGCGMDLALGAMAAGANPQKAVRIACKYNAFCGLPLQIMKRPELKK